MPITINVQRIEPLLVSDLPDVGTKQNPDGYYGWVSTPALSSNNLEAIIAKLNEVIEAFNTMFETEVTNG